MSVRTALRLAMVISGDGPATSALTVLEAIPAGGLAAHQLDAITAQCVRLFVTNFCGQRDHATVLMPELDGAAAEQFSDATCARVRLLTAHSVKGTQVRFLVKCPTNALYHC